MMTPAEIIEVKALVKRYDHLLCQGWKLLQELNMLYEKHGIMPCPLTPFALAGLEFMHDEFLHSNYWHTNRLYEMWSKQIDEEMMKYSEAEDNLHALYKSQFSYDPEAVFDVIDKLNSNG